jgi:hypothetical protein
LWLLCFSCSFPLSISKNLPVLMTS